MIETNYSIIGKDVVIAEDTQIGDFVEIKNAIIGKGVKIKSGVKIGGEPEDRNYSEKNGKVIIKDGAIIFEYATIHSATGDDNTIIGENSMIMAYVHIAHNCKLGKNVTVVNGSQIAGYVEIGNHAFIGGISGIHQYTKIGSYAFLGAFSYLTKDLPPFFSATGIPAKLKGINKVGMERSGFSSEEIKFMRKVFYKLHIKMLSLKEFIEFLKQNERNFKRIAIPFISFIERSKRGILR